MERKYKLTILPLFEEELNHIVDYITYVLHNREAAHQLITDIEAAIYTRLSCPESYAVYPSKKVREYPYYKIMVRNFYIFYVVIEDVMEVRHICYNRRDLQNILDD